MILELSLVRGIPPGGYFSLGRYASTPQKQRPMARGKRTNPLQAVLVNVLAEMGGDPALISHVTGVPRGTVRGIIEVKGTWSPIPNIELTARIRLKVIETIDSVAYGLALKAVAKLNEKMKTASYLELISTTKGYFIKTI
jgi:hypothetical protein